MLTSNNKINSIQLLRAVAVLLVIHYHVLGYQGIANRNSVQLRFFHLKDFGAAGVDLFFVISGFIITIVASRYAVNNQGLHFFIKRVMRVVPLYWLVSSLFIILFFFHNKRLPPTQAIVKTFLFFPFFEKTIAGEIAFIRPVVGVGWTLSFEFLFYLVMAIAIFCGRKKYITVTSVFFLSAIIINYILSVPSLAINFTGNGIMLEFMFGLFIAIIYLSKVFIKPIYIYLMLIAGVNGLVAWIFTGYGNISEATNSLSSSLTLLRSFVWGIPAALVLAALVMMEKVKPVHIYPFWIAIGNASFSIYLTHSIILESLYVRWQRWGLQDKLLPDFLVIISVAILLIGGYIFYRLVELPLLRWLGKYAKPKTAANLT